MLSEIKKNKSLTFHEICNPTIYSATKSNNVANSPIVIFPLAQTVVGAGIVTTIFDNECNRYISILAEERIQLNNKVMESLKINPMYNDARSKGVKLAWKYEKADITMGGRGSADWNHSECQEILKMGKVQQKIVNGNWEGPEGHHQKNVADYPKEQANPDNIKFYKNKEAHLDKGHKGSFRNSTNDEFIDKNKMLKRTNAKRVMMNELMSAGISAVVGFGTGFTLGFVIELARVGISSENISNVFLNSSKTGFEMGALSLGTYCTGRVMSYAMHNIGIDILTKTGALISMTAVGIMSIAVIFTYQCVKLQIYGELNQESFLQIGRQTAFSLSILAVSIAAQGIFGGPAGVITSTSLGLLLLGKNIAELVHNREIEKKLHSYMIEQYKLIVLDG